MTENQNQQVQPKFPTEIIELPSKGLLYPKDNPLASGKIEMKYMTAREEDILSTQSYIAQGIVLDKLFESMIISPIKYEDILLGDRNAIMIAAAKLGYGDTYETKIKTSAGTDIPITINLSELSNKPFDESLITPNLNKFEFRLPKGGQTLEFKLLTVGDSNKIDADLKGLKKLGRSRSDATLTTRLRYMILSVDGDSTAATINEFVNNMLAIDSRELRNHIAKITPDIDLSKVVEDPDTGEYFRADVEIGLNLFYPDYKS